MNKWIIKIASGFKIGTFVGPFESYADAKEYRDKYHDKDCSICTIQSAKFRNNS